MTQSCSQAFYSLAQDEVIRERLIGEGAVPIIINLMLSPIRKVKMDW